jgi:hypothetical protein
MSMCVNDEVSGTMIRISQTVNGIFMYMYQALSSIFMSK